MTGRHHDFKLCKSKWIKTVSSCWSKQKKHNGTQGHCNPRWHNSHWVLNSFIKLFFNSPHLILSTACLAEICDWWQLSTDWLPIEPPVVQGLYCFLCILLITELWSGRKHQNDYSINWQLGKLNTTCMTRLKSRLVLSPEFVGLNMKPCNQTVGKWLVITDLCVQWW